MAGLLRRDFQNTVRQFPLLGSLPVIGALFRSTSFQREDTELVIIVTPRLVRPVPAHAMKLPTDRVQPPSEEELFLLGRTDSAVGLNPMSPAQPAPSIGHPIGQARQPVISGPTPKPQVGVDGKHGHILESIALSADGVRMHAGAD
jgi:pilus assembly protein CpaC